jgi:aspartate-semialdehyde dehydrogenase
MSRKLNVGILAATGTVGQRFVQLLENHPWFEVTELAASDRSVGQTYERACAWKLAQPMPEAVKKMVVKAPEPNLDCDFVLSSLPTDVAGKIEDAFAKADYPVITNASPHRMDEDVPLLIPEVNAAHIDMIPFQKKRRGYDKGFIVTNPNCTAIGLVLALAPLQKAFGLQAVMLTSMQALSGAGYPGVASLDIIDNVVPYIKNEEEKVEEETRKLLGRLENNAFVNAPFPVSASCNRVNVSDGHLETVSVKLEKRVSEADVIEAFRGFASPIRELSLPSAPPSPIIFKEEIDRPQPRLDRDLANGMAAVVGRVRKCPVLDYKFLVLSHNTIRGAAGAAILNAELLKVQGYL